MANKFFSKIGDGLSKAVHGLGNAISNMGKARCIFRTAEGKYHTEYVCMSREEAEALAKQAGEELADYRK